jgi:PPOX class probable F420-dependent enzyme
VQEGAHRRPRDGPQFVVRDSPGAQPCACLHRAGEQCHELLGGLGGIEPAQSTRDGDDVLFMIGVGSRKERNLRRDPRVSVLVFPPDAPYSYAAIRGTATFDPAAGRRLRDELSLKYIGKTFAEHVESTPEAKVGLAETVAVRVTPAAVAGRL